MNRQRSVMEGMELTSEYLKRFKGLKAVVEAKEDEDEFNEYTVTITLREISDEGLESLGIKFGRFG